MFFSPRSRRIYVATALLAIGVPTSTAWWIGRKTDALAAHLATRAAMPSTIGSVDADLTGTIRIDDVAIGDLVRADSIEASVAMSSILASTASADEIRVAAPQINVHVEADGDSDLARLARRFVRPRKPGAAPSKLRRIVVDSGRLTAQIAGVGELSAEGVELLPDAGGVRVVTGEVHLRGANGPMHVELGFSRSAAELALPGAHVGRVLAVAGTGSLAIGDRRVALHDVAAGRLQIDGASRALELRATLDDAGARRPVSVSLQLASATRELAVAIEGDRVPLDVLGALGPIGVELAHAHATGALVARRRGDTFELAVDGTLTGATIDHPAIAPGPIVLGGQLRGALSIAPDAIVVRDATLVTGAAHVTANGWLRRGAPISGQLDVGLERASCAALLDTLPPALRGNLDGMTLAGELSAHAHLTIDLAAPTGDGVALATTFANSCKVTDEPPGADVTTLAGVADQAYPDGTHARVGRGTPGWETLDALPARVSNAFVAAEDGRFREHRGFDATQIARSFEIDLREHRLARGGSTISQQLVKNAFLSQRRSADRKIQEAVLTWRLESRLSKAQILERYLNIIELGPHVYGIGAAAAHWFAVPAKSLTTRQVAFLAALTSEPTSMTRRVRKAGGLDPDTAARIDTILRAMKRDGMITASELDDAKASPLRFAATALDPEK